MTKRTIFIQICGEPTKESDTNVLGLYETHVSTQYPDQVAADIAAQLVTDNVLIDDPASLFMKAFTKEGSQITIDTDTAPTEEIDAVFVRRCVSPILPLE